MLASGETVANFTSSNRDGLVNLKVPPDSLENLDLGIKRR
jgi:hypothetical protein